MVTELGIATVEVAVVDPETTMSGAPAFTDTDEVREKCRVTTTGKVEVAVLLCASDTEHEMVVVPIVKSEPDAGEHKTPTVPSTKSEAEGRV